MRENLRGTKKAPHPELVEGRFALIQAAASNRFGFMKELY